MRELTKSAARLSWALFVYGAQELARQGKPGTRPAAEGPGEPDDETVRNDAEHLADETRERLADDYRSLFELGERAGTRMIDLGFDLLDPRRAVDVAAGMAAWLGRVAGPRRDEPRKDEHGAAAPT